MRQQSKKIIVEIWKDGSRVKTIDFGGDRAGARTMFFAMLNRTGPGKPVLTVNGQELRAADAVKFLKTGRSKRGAALALD